MRFNCVAGTGRAVILSDKQEKLRGLSIILSQYDNRGSWEFDEKSVDTTVVIRLDIAEMTGKRSGL
jgi:nitroimidazol reductase NimA-like FMN-containing flavoprotein (pyridoxamine 5'-phosphate oxidase superfamily)